jgi:hypothetical protein
MIQARQIDMLYKTRSIGLVWTLSLLGCRLVTECGIVSIYMQVVKFTVGVWIL